MTRAEVELELARIGIECETLFHTITSRMAWVIVRFRRSKGDWNAYSTKIRLDDIDEPAEFAARIERDILADLERGLRFYREHP